MVKVVEEMPNVDRGVLGQGDGLGYVPTDPIDMS